jgi:hypothetical protein
LTQICKVVPSRLIKWINVVFSLVQHNLISQEKYRFKQERDINNTNDEDEQSHSNSGTGGVLQFNFQLSPLPF